MGQFSVGANNLGTHLDFLEDADYLRFTESGFLHVETPSGGILYLRLVQVFKGTSGVSPQRSTTPSPDSLKACLR